MKMRRVLTAAVVAVSLASIGAGLAQPGGKKAKTYRDGSVWEVQYIRVKPGMDDAYLSYLSGQWKSMQEAFKKDGLILSYKVITSEGHGVNDFNLMLMTEYKDLATMEANQEKGETIAERVVGDEQKQQQGYKERSEIREIIASRLSREVVLEKK